MVRAEINGATPPGLFHYESGASFDSQRQQRGTASFALFCEPDAGYMPSLNAPVRIYETDDDLSPPTEFCAWYGTIRAIKITWVGNLGHYLLHLDCAGPETDLDTAQVPETTYSGATAAYTATDSYNAHVTGSALTLGTVDAPTALQDVTYPEGTRVSDIWDRAALIAGKQWYVDPAAGTVNMGAIDSNPAPRTLISPMVLAGSISWEQSLDDYRSDQSVAVPPSVMPSQLTVFAGDGSTTAFTLPAAPTSIVSVDVLAGGAQATAAGTFGGVPLPGDLIAIGAYQYRFVNTLDNSRFGDVLIGIDEAACCRNLVDAINAKTAQKGVTYSTPTWANGSVQAGQPQGSPAVSFVITAKSPGTLGNGIALSVNLLESPPLSFAWSAASTSGGADAGTTGIVVPIGSYTVDISAGSTAVTITPAMPYGTQALVTYYAGSANVGASSPAPAYGTVSQHSTLLNQSTPEAALQEANAILTSYSTAPAKFSCTVDVPGWFAGQWVTVSFDRPIGAGALLNGGWLLQQVRATMIPGKEKLPAPDGHFRYQLDFIKELDVPTPTDFWEDAMNTGPSPFSNLPTTAPEGGGNQPGGVSSVTYTRTLLVKDTTVTDDAADHVPVYHAGSAHRILAVLRQAITANLTVRFNVTPVGGSPYVLATVTIPAGTPVDDVLVTDLGIATSPVTYPQLYDLDVFSVDILASDGSTDDNGIASFTIDWRATE